MMGFAVWYYVLAAVGSISILVTGYETFKGKL